MWSVTPSLWTLNFRGRWSCDGINHDSYCTTVLVLPTTTSDGSDRSPLSQKPICPDMPASGVGIQLWGSYSAQSHGLNLIASSLRRPWVTSHRRHYLVELLGRLLKRYKNVVHAITEDPSIILLFPRFIRFFSCRYPSFFLNKMLRPVIWPKKTFFYPIGNTAPSCFTRDLAPEMDADILLLGCGDPRSILYTIHSEHCPCKSGLISQIYLF